jgi:ribose transport system substrate-binding protein
LLKVEQRYELLTEPPRHRHYRIGYAAPGDADFFREVLDGLERASAQHRIALTVVNNRFKPAVALKNARTLARGGVQLAIEFQLDAAIAPELSAIYREARIAVIAVDNPMPGATYFGANNYQAGVLAGRELARYAIRRWKGQVDRILLTELPRVGALPAARMRGALAGMREVTVAAESWPVDTLASPGLFDDALQRVRQYLRTREPERILVAAANDPIALGVSRAFQEAGRDDRCAVIGQNGEPEVRAELRQPRTPLIGSVGYFPE